MSHFKEQKAKLKENIIAFLETKSYRRWKIKDFWNDLSVFMKKKLSGKQYGMTRLTNILPEFADILYCDEGYVHLRPGKGKGDTEEVVVVSDSDGEDNDANNSNALAQASRMTTAPWGSGLAHAERTHIVFDSDSSTESESKQRDRSASMQNSHNSSGFIAFSSNSSSVSRDGGQASHQRYGLSANPSNSASANIGNSPLSIQTMASNFMSQFSASLPQRPNTPGRPVTPSGIPMMRSQSPFPQVMMSTPIALNTRTPIMPLLPSPIQQNPPVAGYGMMGPPPTPPPVPKPAASEWPQNRARTGPPPGTKITDHVPDVIVRPISLPPGTRLTSAQVNSEIKTCRDVLSDAREHVSMERVQNLVLQKFQVRDFRYLNLRERHFDALSEARDLSMAIGKVNSYVQNFVRSRSLCTLYELQECLREYVPDKKNFEDFRLGPLQKMPVVYDLFKFPHDEYIPEITAVDLMSHLKDFLTKYQKWQTQTNMEDFMTYLVEEAFKVESGFSLGIRLRSLPLAIQTLKKSERDSAATRRHVIENLKGLFSSDIHEAFALFRANFLQTNAEGKHDLRLHYMSLTPQVAVKEVMDKFQRLSHIFLSDPSMRRKMDKFQRAFHAFVTSVLEMPIACMLYHLSVCLSKLEVEESAAELLEQERMQQQQQQQQQQQSLLAAMAQYQDGRAPPTKEKLVERIHTYMNRWLESVGHLQLSNIQAIENKILEDFGFKSFSDMGYGRFLELLLKETKLNALLEECGGTSLGTGGKGHHTESVYKPSQSEVHEVLCQANHAGLSQPQQMEMVLCEQYHVTDVRLLGHGTNIARLWRSAQASPKHKSRDQAVYYEAALCGKLGRPTRPQQGQTGILGSQSRESAQACLTLCPLLEDLATWSQWGLVFQPQHGPLREFVERHGGQRTITLKGKAGTTATSDFMALEVEPGKLIKVYTFSGPEQFKSALERDDPDLSAGHLVSLIVANKGVEGTPLALLANHVKTKLLSLHAQSSALATPGAPPSEDSSKTVTDLAVQFVTRMMLKIPLRICVAVAEQVLLKPLSEVVGSDKSKSQVVLACLDQPQHLLQLERLGCLLGISEWWTSSLQPKLEFPQELCVTESLSSGEDLFGLTEQEEEEEVDDDDDEDDDDEDDESESEPDMDEILATKDSIQYAEQSGAADKTATAIIDDDEVRKADDDEDKEIEDDDSQDDDEEEEDVTSTSSSEKESKDDENENKSEEEKGAEDESVNMVGEAMEKMLAVSDEDKEQTREEVCRSVVDSIRQKDFGVGIKLGETEAKLMQNYQELQGRSLQRLSKDLYSKDTHFVLELIQNADDNSYPKDTVPSIKFVIDSSGVHVMNNETGFEDKNIRALCDVGRSTKTKHTIGYIGQKGIGFKSVFRVTGRPEIHSNGFHICFDVDSGPIGYILPHWIADTSPDEEAQSWQTRIILPWTKEIKQHLHTHAARFNDIKPSLLLFLHRLREITIDNKVNGIRTSMLRKDLGDGEIQISHSGVTDRWLVVRKVLDASEISMQMKSGVEVASTEIALAFPLRGKNHHQQAHTRLAMLPVFAFLPLRNYGFRFIIQGDFDVPSSREDVDRDSSWNQWLRNEIHTLFIKALEAFKSRPDLSQLEALIQYLQFVPLEDEVSDFFKPVTTHILAQLRGRKCLPVLTADKKGIEWRLPSQCVLVQDPLVREVVSPELLQHQLGLHFLHPEVAAALGDQPLASVLGVKPISTSHLLDIGRFIAQNWSGTSEQVMEIAKWLACIHRSLDDFQENSQIIEELSNMRVMPLADGNLVSVADTMVFLLSDESSTKFTSTRRRDPLTQLQQDLNIVHPALTSTADDEVNSQVVKLLLRTGAVKQLTPHDLVHSHILPVLRSDAWKQKSRETLISYLVYIKSELERQPSLIDLPELRTVVRLVTNHEVVSPEEKSVHFSTAFGNKIDLQKAFPGIEWTLVDAAYLPPNPTALEKQSWHNFLSALGVVDFLHVKRVEVKFDKDNIHETPWAPYKDMWPESPDGYNITDFECEELHQLVTASQNLEQQQRREDFNTLLLKQMGQLFELLDSQWTATYSKYTPTQLRSAAGHILRESIETSFAIHLKTLRWIPAEWKVVTAEEDGKLATVSPMVDLCKGSDIYLDCPTVRTSLSHTVKYLSVPHQKGTGFSTFLGIRDSVSMTQVLETYTSWCKRDSGKANTPSTFCTTRNHIFHLYSLFKEELKPKDAQDLFHNHPAIFVPVIGHNERGWCQGNQLIVGRMLAREEVWWQDTTGLFYKYRDSLCKYNSPLGKKSILQPYYGQMLEEMFQGLVRPQWEPSTLNLSELLKHVADTRNLLEEGVLADTLSLFSHIGARLLKSEDKRGGVPTPEASLARVELQPVVKLLSSSAVFPSKGLQWVNPSTQLLMLPDSQILEELFTATPNVHFLLTELSEKGRGGRPRDSRSRTSGSNIDKESIDHVVSLCGENIKPVSECVSTQGITSGFQPSTFCQTYMHKVVGLIQRFLYFSYPEVYEEIKEGRAQALNKLMFVEVFKLEAKYELIGHPEIYKVQSETCMVQDNYFYLHQAHASNPTEINKEVAKYFSNGNKDCIRELRGFLTQLVPILEGKSLEPLEEFLLRQKNSVLELPKDQEVWGVPLPIIQQPEPEPEPEEEEEEPQMTYGRATDSYGGSESGGQDGEENQGLKCWPPRSGLVTDQDAAKPRTEGEKKSAPAGMWPPPKPPNSSRAARALPSNIRVEKEVTEDESRSGDATTGAAGRGDGGGTQNVARSGAGSGSGSTGSTYYRQGSGSTNDGGDSGEGKPRPVREGGEQRGNEEGEGPRRERGEPYQHGERSRGEGEEGGGTNRPSFSRQSSETLSSAEKPSPGGCKRKASESLREGEPAVLKRPNSQVEFDEPCEEESMGQSKGEQARQRQPQSADSGEQRPSSSARGTGRKNDGAPDRTTSSSVHRQESPHKQTSDRRKISFTIPIWNDSNLDLEYTDLTKAVTSTLPNLEPDEEQDHDWALKVGHWGESMVYDYLLHLKSSEPNIEAVLWANKEGEKGQPWDFEVIYSTGLEEFRTVYIEVKSTTSQDKEVFEVSPHQLELALREGPNFQVYRVFGAGRPGSRLVRVENVAQRLKVKQIKLYMVL